MSQEFEDQHQRDPYADDELVPFDVQGYSGNRGMWLLGLGVLFLLALLFFLFKAYQPGVRDRDQAPKIMASDAPDKVAAENNGDSKDPNEDLKIYDAMNGNSDDGEVTLSNSAEVPATRPGTVTIDVKDRNDPAPVTVKVPEPAPIAVPTPAPVTTTGDSRYVVQLASLRSRNAAEDTWAGIKSKHSTVLPAGSYMDIARAEVPNKGTFYRLRLAGMADKNVAERVCSQLKARNQTCFISTK